MESHDNNEQGTPITGAELYALYARKLAAQACAVDAWGDLDDIEQNAWRMLATDVLFRATI